MPSKQQPRRWFALCRRCPNAKCSGHDTEQQARTCKQRHDEAEHAHPYAVKDWRAR